MRLPHASLILAFLAAPAATQSIRFEARHELIPYAPDFSEAALAADFDQDGDTDFFVGFRVVNLFHFKLLVNEGRDRFTELDADALGVRVATNLTASFNELLMDAADLDGDGDLDVLLGIDDFFSPPSNVILINQGGNQFEAVFDPLGYLLMSQVLLEDMNGDGHPDAVTSYSNDVRIQFNDGSGGFTEQLLLNTGGWQLIRSLAAGDLDGDGDPDLVLGTIERDALLVNDGKGGFSELPEAFPNRLLPTLDLALGDVDGDGDLDVLAGNGPSGAPQADGLYINQGSGPFADASPNLPSLGGSTRVARLVDLTGDQHLDALLWKTNQAVQLHENDGRGQFGPPIELFSPPFFFPGTANTPFDLTLADLGADGDSDVLTSIPGEDRLFLGNGNGEFTDVSSEQTEQLAFIGAPVVGDVTGDGRVEVVGGSYAEPNRVFRYDEVNLFEEIPDAFPMPAAPPETRELVLGDVDQDGDLDVVSANRGPAGELFLNDGLGFFVDASEQLPLTGANAPSSAELGDLDLDGDLDVVLGNEGIKNRLFLNDGGGLFSQSFTIPQDPTRTLDVALGDVDNDGDLDAFVGNGGIPLFGAPQANDLLVNDGTAALTEDSADFDPYADSTFAVALVDIDADGDLDAFAGSTAVGASFDRFHLGDGLGNFELASDALPEPATGFTSGVHFGDLDADGDVDAIRTGNEPAIYENDGAGSFAVWAGEPAGLPSGAVLSPPFDIDGDGDLDTVHVGANMRILVNRTRQLLWRSLPRAGVPFDLRVDGPPAGAWVLALAEGPAEQLWPPFGLLRLELATLVPIRSGALDAAGSAELSILLPDDPAFVGATLYWQALVGLPFALTNLERTLITDL